MYFGRTSGSDWIFPARTSDSSDCNGYICCYNGTIIVCPAFDGDHDTLWFYHAAPCASCAVYFSLLYT